MTDKNLETTVKNEEILDISIERVDKLNSPLLVIGLGGTGADIVRTVKRTFAERYKLPRDKNDNPIPIPARTAYLVIDSDTKSKNGFGDSEYVNITLQGIREILKPDRRDFNLSEFERKWVNRHLDSDSQGIGAGTYRQAARFMLSRNFAKVYAAIKGALQTIVTVSAGDGASSGRTEIVLATGICGGTGSGTFLDIAQIIRYCMGAEPTLSGLTYKITAYLAMPDVSLPQVGDNAALKSILQQNGFAALKELDFWMRVGEHKTPYTMQYSGSQAIAWQVRPFDNCILMSAIGVNGEAYAEGYKVIQKTIAENLLHYLAYEQASTNAQGQVEYTYISYEDNLKATVTAMEKRLPVFYGYRAVGAYTKRIPKKKLLYYEGKLLFDTFIPSRDQQGRLIANPALKQDGKSPVRAKEIIGTIQTLYQNFSADVHLPTFCNVQANEQDQLERMRELQPKPHDRLDTKAAPWLSTGVAPAAMKAARAYLSASWQRFTKFASDVISDPALGPFSLMEYLSDINKGLLPALIEELRSWDANVPLFTNNKAQRYEECRNTWGNFLRPPLLSKNRSIESYLQALKNYFDTARKLAYMQEHAAALKMLVDRIKEYLDHAIEPLCEDLEQLQAEFGLTEGTDDARIVSDIFALDTVKGRIDTQFREGNTNSKVTVDFLGKLCAESFKTEESVDAHGTGVTFTYRVQGKNSTLDTMRQSLDDCFGVINGQSLDAIMEQTVGTDPAAQQSFIDDLGRSVINSAQPLFAQNSAFAAEDKAEFNYLSVPDNAQAHIARYKATLSGKNTIPKGSSLRDHIYCTAAWDGLPLYRYALMDTLESVYAANLARADVSMGVHLVWDGELNSEYTSNWTKLPSPCPYYFFGSRGKEYAQRYYEEVRDLTNRARKCGMLEVDAAGSIPSFRLRLFYADAQRKNIRAAQTMIDEVDAIRAAMDPNTGNKIAPAAVKARVEKYLEDAVGEGLPCDRKPTVLAPVLGLQNEPCDPWDAAVAANPASLITARRNHVTLSNEMAAAVIATNPRIILALKHQLSGFEYAYEVMHGIERETMKWEPRAAYAPHVAEMLIYKVIVPSTDGYSYTSESTEMHPVIQPVLLSEDIQGETLVTKVAAYLGDQAEDHLVRAALENQVKNKKEDLRARSNNGTLGKEEIQTILESITWVNGKLSQETNVHKERQRKIGADRQKEENILTMLGAMKAKADNETDVWNNLI